MPKAQRCAYKEGRARCPRNGTVARKGEPPLCGAHRVLLEEMQRRANGSPLGNLISDLLAGERVTTDQIFDVVGSIFDRGPAPAHAPANGAPRQPQAAQRQAQQARDEARLRAAEAARARQRAIQVLGFPAGSTPSKDEVRDRRKDLARKHHPDKGGSLEQMTKINQAADVLLGSDVRPS